MLTHRADKKFVLRHQGGKISISQRSTSLLLSCHVTFFALFLNFAFFSFVLGPVKKRHHKPTRICTCIFLRNHFLVVLAQPRLNPSQLKIILQLLMKFSSPKTGYNWLLLSRFCKYLLLCTLIQIRETHCKMMKRGGFWPCNIPWLCVRIQIPFTKLSSLSSRCRFLVKTDRVFFFGTNGGVVAKVFWNICIFKSL